MSESLVDIGFRQLAFGHPSMLLVLAFAFNLIVCSVRFHSRAMSTPYAWASRAVDKLEQRYNRSEMTAAMRRADGVSTTAFLVITGLLIGLVADGATIYLPFGWLITAVLAGAFLGIRSYLDRSAAVIDSLEHSPLAARSTVALLTGRNTFDMDSEEMTRVGVEYTARNLNEGVVAAAFYFYLFGLGGFFAYGIIFISAQLLEECSEWTRDFAWAPTRLHEVLVWPVNYFSAILIAIAAAPLSPRGAVRAVRTAFGSGASIRNWASRPSIAALAGALELRLYRAPCALDLGEMVLHVGEEAQPPLPDHFAKARQIYVTVTFLIVMLALVLTSTQIKLPLTYWLFF